VFCSGVIFKTVQSRLAVVSKNLEEASYDLGANTIQTFFYVTLPNIRTAVISGCLMAFVLSFDETLITFFVIGPQMTLPLKIWAMMKASFNPQVHALASIVFITSTLLVLLFSKYILGRETRSGIY
jgi:ABC-type spermidine/putrescine transport system permease subunit II